MMDIFLADAFEVNAEETKLELIVTVININLGHNIELLENCRMLKEYAQFIECVRAYHRKGYSLKKAIDYAAKDCIEADILREILEKNRAEVKKMILTDYSVKRHMKSERIAARKEGWEEGREEGREEGIRAFIIDYEEEGLKKEQILFKLYRRFDLSEDMAEQYYEKYGKI